MGTLSPRYVIKVGQFVFERVLTLEYIENSSDDTYARIGTFANARMFETRSDALDYLKKAIKACLISESDRFMIEECFTWVDLNY